jgi:hypothetical protein
MIRDIVAPGVEGLEGVSTTGMVQDWSTPRRILDICYNEAKLVTL